MNEVSDSKLELQESRYQRLLEARKFQMKGNHQKAKKILGTLLELERSLGKESEETLYNLGISCLKLKENNQAILYLTSSSCVSSRKDRGLVQQSQSYQFLTGMLGTSPFDLLSLISDYEDNTQGLADFLRIESDSNYSMKFAPVLEADTSNTDLLDELQNSFLNNEFDIASQITRHFLETYDQVGKESERTLYYGRLFYYDARCQYLLAENEEDINSSVERLFESMMEDFYIARFDYNPIKAPAAHMLLNLFSADEMFLNYLGSMVKQRENRFRLNRSRFEEYTRILQTPEVKRGRDIKTDNVSTRKAKSYLQVAKKATENHPQRMIKEIEQALRKNQKMLDESIAKPRRIDIKTPNQLLIIRKWNSITPRCIDIVSSGRKQDKSILGGGYFLIWKGKGIAIDPGYDFLRNLYEEGYSVSDIDLILATHAHDDHTAEIEAIYSIDYKIGKILSRKEKSNNLSPEDEILKKLRKERGRNGIPLIGSEGVQLKYSSLTRNNKLLSIGLAECAENRKKKWKREITNAISKFNLQVSWCQTNHNESPWMLNNTGLGYILELGKPVEYRIGITGDTRDYDVIPINFDDLDILILHLGTYRDSSSDHMGVEAAAKLLWISRPKLALVAEFGQEFNSKRDDVTKEIIALMPGQQQSPNNIRRDLPVVIPTDIGFTVFLSKPLKVKGRGISGSVTPDRVKFEDKWQGVDIIYSTT